MPEVDGKAYEIPEAKVGPTGMTVDANAAMAIGTMLQEQHDEVLGTGVPGIQNYPQKPEDLSDLIDFGSGELKNDTGGPTTSAIDELPPRGDESPDGPSSMGLFGPRQETQPGKTPSGRGDDATGHILRRKEERLQREQERNKELEAKLTEVTNEVRNLKGQVDYFLDGAAPADPYAEPHPGGDGGGYQPAVPGGPTEEDFQINPDKVLPKELMEKEEITPKELLTVVHNLTTEFGRVQAARDEQHANEIHQVRQTVVGMGADTMMRDAERASGYKPGTDLAHAHKFLTPAFFQMLPRQKKMEAGKAAKNMIETIGRAYMQNKEATAKAEADRVRATAGPNPPRGSGAPSIRLRRPINNYNDSEKVALYWLGQRRP